MSAPGKERTELITLALARWKALHGEVSTEDYRLIVAAVDDTLTPPAAK